MPLDENNTKTFHRILYAGKGMLQTVTCLKRDNDQRQGTVRRVKIFQCRWSQTQKSGEPLQGDMSAEHRRVLHVPTVSMKKAGIAFFNNLDRFIDREGVTWQPESSSTHTSKLFLNHHCMDCRRCDPPGSP